MTIKFGNFANFIVRNFVVIWEAPKIGTRKGGLFGEGVFSRKVRFLAISRDSREGQSVQITGIRPFSRDSSEFRGSRDSFGEKTPFVMTRFLVPTESLHKHTCC